MQTITSFFVGLNLTWAENDQGERIVFNKQNDRIQFLTNVNDSSPMNVFRRELFKNISKLPANIGNINFSVWISGIQFHSVIGYYIDLFLIIPGSDKLNMHLGRILLTNKMTEELQSEIHKRLHIDWQSSTNSFLLNTT